MHGEKAANQKEVHTCSSSDNIGSFFFTETEHEPTSNR